MQAASAMPTAASMPVVGLIALIAREPAYSTGFFANLLVDFASQASTFFADLLALFAGSFADVTPFFAGMVDGARRRGRGRIAGAACAVCAVRGSAPARAGSGHARGALIWIWVEHGAQNADEPRLGTAAQCRTHVDGEPAVRQILRFTASD